MSEFFARSGQSGQESFRQIFSLLTAFVCGLLAMDGFAADPKLSKSSVDSDWKIEIIPGESIGPSPIPKFERTVRQALAAQSNTNLDPKKSTTVPDVVPADASTAMPAGLTSASYNEVYHSIPFSRSEYLANPNYRHEATIELLLGQIRPKTVTNVTAPTATCCQPLPATLVRWFSPWGTDSFDYRKSRYRP